MSMDLLILMEHLHMSMRIAERVNILTGEPKYLTMEELR